MKILTMLLLIATTISGQTLKPHSMDASFAIGYSNVQIQNNCEATSTGIDQLENTTVLASTLSFQMEWDLKARVGFISYGSYTPISDYSIEPYEDFKSMGDEISEEDEAMIEENKNASGSTYSLSALAYVLTPPVYTLSVGLLAGYNNGGAVVNDASSQYQDSDKILSNFLFGPMLQTDPLKEGLTLRAWFLMSTATSEVKDTYTMREMDIQVGYNIKQSPFEPFFTIKNMSRTFDEVVGWYSQPYTDDGKEYPTNIEQLESRFTLGCRYHF